MIYRHFGDINQLIEAYVVKNDYWLRFSNSMTAMIDLATVNSTQSHAALKNQLKYFLNELKMQRLILWEISSNIQLMKSIQ